MAGLHDLFFMFNDLTVQFIGEQIDYASMKRNLDRFTGERRISDGRQLKDRYTDENKNRFLAHLTKKLEEYGKRMVVWSANGRRSSDIIKDIDKLLEAGYPILSEQIERIQN